MSIRAQRQRPMPSPAVTRTLHDASQQQHSSLSDHGRVPIQPAPSRLLAPTHEPSAPPFDHQFSDISILPPRSTPPADAASAPVNRQTHVRILPRQPLFRTRDGAGEGTDGMQEAVSIERSLSGPQRGAAESSAHSPSHGHAVSIQRKVFIANKFFNKDPIDSRQKTKSRRRDIGLPGRTVGEMMADPYARYFRTKDELFRHARGETDDIGYVQAGPLATWVRLPPGLLVLGEQHNRTTLFHVVKAVSTKKFMHEGYTQWPEDLRSTGLSGLEEAMAARHAKLDADAGWTGGVHTGEGFYPKVLRGLYGIREGGTNNRLELMLYKWAVLAAREYAPSSPVAAYYQRHGEILDALAKGGKVWSEPGNWEVFEGFRDEFAAHAYPRITQERRTAPEQWKAFEAKWHRGEQYPGGEFAPINLADKMRDFSIYRHIKTAKDKGYRLYGLGDKHRVSLAALLDEEHIAHMTVDTFLEEQKERHPQR